MFLSLDLANLALFCAQELGVAMGLGAQTVMMIAYFQAMRDGLVDAKEAQFLRATRRVSFVALATIVVSGLLITALHVMAGDAVIIFSPAYLFKWLLIIVVIALTAFAGSIPKNIFEMLISANWYALFFVHVLAPVTGWINLLEWWVVWLAGFGLCWYAMPFFAHKKSSGAAKLVPSVPDRVAEKQIAAKPKEKELEPPKPKETPIKLEERPVIQLPKELKTPTIPVASTTPIKPIPQQTLAITPTDIPMPATKTTDTPFLPKVPPLQPIPVPTTAAPAVPKAPDAAPDLQKPAVLQDSLAINVMPKSPDQAQKA